MSPEKLRKYREKLTGDGDPIMGFACSKWDNGVLVKCEVCISNTLNPIVFSETLVHELAHVCADLTSEKCPAHGREWGKWYSRIYEAVFDGIGRNRKKLPWFQS